MSFWFVLFILLFAMTSAVVFFRQRKQHSALKIKLDSTERNSAALHLIFNSVNTPTWLEDGSGTISFNNKAFQELIIGSKAPPDQESYEKTNLTLLAEAPLGKYEEWLTKGDGSIDCYQIQKTPLNDGKVLGQATLITEFKERENKFIEAEIRMTEALKVTHIGVWEWNIKQDTWYATASYFTMLGYPPSEGDGDRQKELEKIHPEDRPHVIETITSILEGTLSAPRYQYEARIRHANGEYHWISVRCTVTEFAENGKPACMLGVRIDIDERKKAEQQVAWLANHDPLTSLPNRTALYERFQKLANCSEQRQVGLALLFVDLDRFKNINDTMGHSTGDKLLITVAERMKSLVGESGYVARQGGDEFIILLPYSSDQEVKSKAVEVHSVLSQRYQIELHQFVITPSIGISLFPRDGRDFDTLYKHADTAMYGAKRSGRNGFTFFTEEMQATSTRTLLLENALHDAIDENELHLNLQPQMNLITGEVIAAEVLLRWHSKRLGTVSPAEFIPIAEDTGQIIPIGEWVLSESIKLLKQWLEEGTTPVKLAVNLSVVQFQTQDLPQLIEQTLNEYQVPPHLLEVELTERGTMANPKRAIETMEAFHNMGVQTSIDDFGTGYSSLSYLQRFPIYKLKIDQSFIRDMTVDANDYAIVSAIITLAQQLGMKTIAEGVETKEQLELLKQLGCEEIQGYYLSKPIPPIDFRDHFLSSDNLYTAPYSK